jgi:hypothetical protein
VSRTDPRARRWPGAGEDKARERPEEVVVVLRLMSNGTSGISDQRKYGGADKHSDTSNDNKKQAPSRLNQMDIRWHLESCRN